MIYCQLLHDSTGYIAGTIPPQFSKDAVKPIDVLGSDGRVILDARKSVFNLTNDCKAIAENRRQKITGFKIIKANNYSEDGRILKTVIF